MTCKHICPHIYLPQDICVSQTQDFAQRRRFLTVGTALTANLKTSWPFIAMLSKDPLAEACVLWRAFMPSPQYSACRHQ